jgi:hypothetical protein
LGNVDGGFIALLPLTGKEGPAIAELMKRYEDLRPQLADAALVHLAGREGSGRFLPSTSVTSLYIGVRVNAPS